MTAQTTTLFLLCLLVAVPVRAEDTANAYWHSKGFNFMRRIPEPKPCVLKLDDPQFGEKLRACLTVALSVNAANQIIDEHNGTPTLDPDKPYLGGPNPNDR